jgi:hypothetical protein
MASRYSLKHFTLEIETESYVESWDGKNRQLSGLSGVLVGDRGARQRVFIRLVTVKALNRERVAKGGT